MVIPFFVSYRPVFRRQEDDTLNLFGLTLVALYVTHLSLILGRAILWFANILRFMGLQNMFTIQLFVLLGLSGFYTTRNLVLFILRLLYMNPLKWRRARVNELARSRRFISGCSGNDHRIERQNIVPINVLAWKIARCF